MSPRELVRAARQSIETAEARLRLGEALLVFPEGSRSRSGQMQPLLPGVARYLKGKAAWVLPIGITHEGRWALVSELLPASGGGLACFAELATRG